MEIAVGTQFHARHGTKTTPVFLLVDRKASWSLLQSSVSLLSGSTSATKKNLFLYPEGERSGLRKPKKDKHQH